MMKDICALCIIPEEKPSQIVRRGEYVYSAIPHAPLTPGHVMILPYRHVLFEDLRGEELVELRDMSCQLKDRLVSLYPKTPPPFTSLLNTTHASVPEHFHCHLVPSPVSVRKLMASYDASFPRNKIIPDSGLELMANKLR